MAEFIRYNPLHGRSGSPQRNRTVQVQITQHPDQIPAFLIPGIFGNEYEMRALADKLNSIYQGRRPIYIYSEETDDTVPSEEYDYADDSGSVDGSDFSNDSDPVVAAIGAIMPKSPLPYLLIGYSNGGKKAVNAAKSLQSMGYDARAFVIDATPSASTSAYYKSNSANSIMDLVSIVNYAAQLSGMKNLLTQQHPDLDKFAYLQTESLIEELSTLLQSLNTDFDGKLFDRYIHEVKELLSQSSNTENTSTTRPSLNKITTLFTDDTLSKYRMIPGHKWENEATEVENVTEPGLTGCTHRTILQKPFVDHLANAIHRSFLSKSMTEEQLLRKLRDYLDEALERASNSTSQSNSSETGSNPPSSPNPERYKPIPESVDASSPIESLSDDESNKTKAFDRARTPVTQRNRHVRRSSSAIPVRVESTSDNELGVSPLKVDLRSSADNSPLPAPTQSRKLKHSNALFQPPRQSRSRRSANSHSPLRHARKHS